MKTSKGINWFDRQGKPLTDYDEIEKLLRDFDYKVVKQTELPNGKFVSTIWLGLDHSFMGGPPLIFETMVFPKREDFVDLDCERYSTEKEALVGHELMVKKWNGKR